MHGVLKGTGAGGPGCAGIPFLQKSGNFRLIHTAINYLTELFVPNRMQADFNIQYLHAQKQWGPIVCFNKLKQIIFLGIRV